MKWLLLIIMAAAAGAIFYYRDELRGKVDASTSTGPATPAEEIIATGETPAGSGAGNRPPSGSATGSGAPMEGSRPPVRPTRPQRGAGEDDEVAKRYPMPKFKSIEEAVGNWNAIPPSAFPRQITLSEPVKIVLPGGVGSSTLPANSGAFALSSRGGMLTVGKTVSASARGQIDINSTDYKQILGKEFDQWKQRQEQIVMKKRERHRGVLAQTRSIRSAPSGNQASSAEHEKELGKKPEQLSDGRVPLMLASLKKRDITEITPDIIRAWGPIIREVVDGEAYWTATVEYETVSMFGELNTEAQALMRHGKVLSWVYTGSGDTVP
ncbi:MAG: hypothetical protein ACR2RV_15920 [Verrucomicrobiales bacterium]